MPVCTVSSAGVSTSTMSMRPPSSPRCTVAGPEPPHSILVTTATRGSPSSSARAVPVEPCTESLDWTPQRTRSGDSRRTASARARAREIGSSASASTRTARSTPIARQRRSATSGALAPAVPLAEAQGLLGGARIPLVQRLVEVVGIDVPPIGGEPDLVAQNSYLLDANDNLHTTAPTRGRPLAGRPGARSLPAARSPRQAPAAH